MPKAPTHSLKFRQPLSSGPMIDGYALITLLVCAYVTIIEPLIYTGGGSDVRVALTELQKAEPNLAGRIFFPAISAISIILAIRNRSRFRGWPPHMICLLVVVAFAGASVSWAFRPEASFVRFVQLMMVLSAIVLPAMLAAPTVDLMRGMFLCFAVGAILNIFIGHQDPDGYSGFLRGKNELGEFSGIAVLLALHETLYPGFRRVFGIAIMVAATLLLVWSESKTSFALALACPVLAGAVWGLRKAARISPAITFGAALLCYAVVSSVSNFNSTYLTEVLYGDSTFSARTAIWDFAFTEIAHRPLFGWGYRSFWLVGTDAPSVIDAPGWVGSMPSGHNGYYDTILELGYIGLALLMIFIFATLHAIGRVADSERGRAWTMLSLALFIIIHNCLESTWMRGDSALWVVFLIVAVEIARYLQALPQANVATPRFTTRVPSRRPSPGAAASVQTARNAMRKPARSEILRKPQR
jgi:exopolysaccharide production protein ExoQ